MNRIFSLLKIPIGALQSLAFLTQKKPGLVIGVGGYVSGPLVFSAWLLRIPILIHEQNSIPGATNKLLGKIADKVAVSFKESLKFFPANKTIEMGNLIREELSGSKKESAPSPGGKFNVLVVGGSQGAHSINAAMIEAVDVLSEMKNQLHIVHQTGESDHALVKTSMPKKESLQTCVLS